MVAHQLPRELYEYSGRIFNMSYVPVNIQNSIEMDLII